MKVVSFLKSKKVEVLILLSLFLFAFGVRVIPSERFPNIYGFDSFWAARMTKYMITGEKPGWPFTPINDTATEYPWGRPGQRPSEVGWWFVNFLTYKLAGGGSNFDYDLFAKVASWNVAILASLAIPAMYLFGKKAFNRLTGLASALFLAVSSNHLFYSIYGHAENDGLGFTLFFLSLFAFVLTVKDRKKWNLVFLFIVLSWLAITWQSYAVAALLISGTFFVYFLLSLVKGSGFFKDNKEKKMRREWMIYSLITGALSAALGIFLTKSVMPLVGLSAFSLSALVGLIVEYYNSKEKPKLNELNKFTKSTAIVVILILIGLGFFGSQFFTSPLKFIGVTGSETGLLSYEQRMLQTIAEQNPVQGATFIDRLSTLSGSFGVLIWLAFAGGLIALAKVMIMPFVRKDFTYEFDVLAAVFILFSLWTLTQRAITMFFLAGAVAFGAGYFFAQAYRLFEIASSKVKQLEWGKMVVVFIVIASFFSYSIVAINQMENFGYDVPPEWFQTFNWINDHLPKGSVITAWWDYGHWLNYFNGDKIYTSLDNIQDRKDIIYTVASAFTHTTPCSATSPTDINCEATPEALEKAEQESLSLLKPLKTTHILIDKEIIGGFTGGKFGALEHIANNQIGCMMTFSCYDVMNGNEQGVVCNSGLFMNNDEPIGLYLTKQQWGYLQSTPWPGTVAPLPVISLKSGKQITSINTRWFAKTENFSGKTLYGSGLVCGAQFFQGGANANAPVVYSFIHRLFFNDPSLKHVEKVYDDGWNVIYAVNFSGIPDPEEFDDWTKQHSVLCTGQAESRC